MIYMLLLGLPLCGWIIVRYLQTVEELRGVVDSLEIKD